MRISFLVLMVIFAFAHGRVVNRAGSMVGSNYVLVDSFYVDGTGSYNTRAFALDLGAQFSLLVEARDDSTAGFASDSACVKVELKQAFPLTGYNGKQYFVGLPSKAHPDSTYPGTDWLLFDSLDIRDMDTAAAFYRNMYVDSSFRDPRVLYGDSVLVADSAAQFGAFAYKNFSPDFTPACYFTVTGLSPNLVSGAGSFWKFRVVQLEGESVKAK